MLFIQFGAIKPRDCRTLAELYPNQRFVLSLKIFFVAETGCMNFFKTAVVMIIPAAVFVGNAMARDDGRYSGSPLKPWFDTLKSAKGLCCSVADGFALADP